MSLKRYRSPLVYHFVNGVCSLGFFGLYSFYLEGSEYLLWALLLTIGGCVLQFEAGIQNLGIRKISKRYNSGDGVRVPEVFRWYLVLAGLTALVFGCFFWNFAINGRLDDPILVASFVVYAFAYLLNFSFGINNSVALGADRLDGFYYSLTFSRVVHMISSWAFLSFGWGIWGLSLSFLLSVAASVICIGCIARTLRKSFDQSRASLEPGSSDKAIWKFSLYSFMAFWLYRGVVLGVAFLGIEDIGLTDYLFTLNLLSMAALLSMIPFQVRLPLLVRLIADQKSTGKELIKLLALSVGVFLAFGLGLYVFALFLRNFSEASFGLLDSSGYLLLIGALLLEVIFGGLALYFATIEKFTFVLPYTVSVLLGSMIGMFLYSKHQTYIYLILIPALTQILVALPLIGREWFGIRRLRLN